MSKPGRDQEHLENIRFAPTIETIETIAVVETLHQCRHVGPSFDNHRIETGTSP